MGLRWQRNILDDDYCLTKKNKMGMKKYLAIGILLTLGLILVMSESANGGLVSTMVIKAAGIACLGVVALVTRGEAA